MRSLYFELPDLVAQCPIGYAQELGGSGLVVTGLLQGLQDRVALQVFELVTERARLLGKWRGRRGSRGRVARARRGTQPNVLSVDQRPAAQRRGALQHVFQLSHVAR